MSNLTPIILHRDGLALMQKGHTQAGDFPFLVQHNPDLISEVIRERRRRDLIQEANWIQWSAA